MPEVILPGASGRIEGRYSPGKRPNAPIALILHPHPKAGGHMNNPVAVTLHQLFQQRGFAYVHTPIVTASDCEGAGELFRVTTLDPVAPHLIIVMAEVERIGEIGRVADGQGIKALGLPQIQPVIIILAVQQIRFGPQECGHLRQKGAGVDLAHLGHCDIIPVHIL